MSTYRKVTNDLNFVQRERETRKFWEDHHIFEKSMDPSKKQSTFTFYDGPPTANGKPHIGHVLTRVIKDMIPRYQTMKGNFVPRKAGWDTHGLPVEIGVEKKLGLDGKDQIEEYGIQPFVEQCKESVWEYKGMWEDFSGAAGFWADMDHPYITYDNNFIESEWWGLKQIWDKKLLYKGFKVVPYCPRCGTPLSSQEVAQGYKTVRERSAVVRFKAKGEDAYFLAWTTTPWTLPSNIALCVNPLEVYAKVKCVDGFTYYMAKALLDKVLGPLAKDGQPAYQIIETMQGADLEYREYEPLYDCAAKAVEKSHKKAFFIEVDDYVTMSDGTGIVHEAPAFGEDDARVGRKYDLPFVQMVDEKGCMKAETPFAGMRCKPTEEEMANGAKSADPAVLADLEERGLLFDAPSFEHDYPHCWRCDTPLLYFARESWFIKMTAVKDDLVKNNKSVNWIPPSIGEGRFGNWLENIQDWGISRNRYWGTPLNIWECDDCGHQECIGSRAELVEKTKDAAMADIELHRPYIDRVTFPCPHCGKPMHRVPEVVDVWFDSGAMPYAQHHYPFENQDKFEQQFPADFISEAVDQTRGWFYSLMAESTILFGRAPYKNVIVLGHVLDGKGQKMSKSKGNAVDPMEALSTYGADAIRWYFYTNSNPWLPNKFHGKAVEEGQRKFLNTLWNTYAFYVLYANIDAFDPTKYRLQTDQLSVMDRWALSRLNSTVKTVDENLGAYRIPEAGRALQDFIDDLSNWYVRRSRQRYWAKGLEQDKINAYLTLYTCLVTFVKLAAPMIPFMTDEIYRNLVCSLDADAPESVHLCDFPACDENLIDEKLESDMKELLKIVVFGRACRNASNIKNRQPLAQMYIKAENHLNDFYAAIIEDELNVKKAEFVTDVTAFTTYIFKPQLRTVGPKYGRFLGQIQKALSGLDGNTAYAQLQEKGKITLPEVDASIELTEDDLLITMTQKEGYVTDGDNNVTVVLNTNLTDALREEGMVREIISKLQTMRKEAGFEVMDHIAIAYRGNEKIGAICAAHGEEITAETMADSIAEGAVDGYSKEWDINGEKVTLSVARLG
ncbi:isoleucine--tRNA ligase [Shuttleworthella sp. MSX8B]|uniref:isoleucine--tRNA ligase n=1 Tax=Shuttleworthella sp. MSX8B TaxID=936574 RepID=UPI0004474188|nr:isoleucine--tRNA ligase [Shuttleworthia sp. MSX8B]EUB16785.1 isoleucine--tRNA ligase [Shuttleworthia sp. MSX8B]